MRGAGVGAEERQAAACGELPSLVRLDRDLPREALERRIVRDRDEPWCVYGHCVDCGQAWLVERADAQSRDPGVAIKIPDPRTWTADDERAVRIDFLRRSRGGDAAAGECIVDGCHRRPLNGMAYCAVHAFDLAGARE